MPRTGPGVLGYLNLKQEKGISPSRAFQGTPCQVAIQRVTTNNIADTKRGEMTGVHATVSREVAVQRTYSPSKYRGGLLFAVGPAHPHTKVREVERWT